ncbi:7568_t:CDS:2 [Dentiscutata erythropus]|uniref:7568_t:CDS:1 n=1 Tax=Dentiscutata erythropus TaxID=1348616 RepID=A0A9N9FJY7_9GLOM|nr:7568_t:CDS:2 [Dentiscutata erythropus]
MVFTRTRNRWSKKLQRISESRNIEFFVLTSLIQFLVMIFFYLRLWNRFTIIIHSTDSGPDGCLSYNYISSNNYPSSFVLEFLFLVLYQVFQFNFALNAIHFLEIRRIVNEINVSCAITPDPQYLAYDFPFILTSLIFSITMGYFAYKVRRDLSGRIYKKIGLDMTMQAVPYCYVGIITFIYAWRTTDTFNQGLREYVGLRLNRNHELIIRIEDVEDYRPRRVSNKVVDNYQTDEIKKAVDDEIKKPDDVLIFKKTDDTPF